MNRTIAGRIALLRGARQQLKTFAKQAGDLGPWWPVAVPFLIFVYGKSYRDEQKKMLDERMQAIKQEKAMFEKVERQLVNEIASKSARPWLIRRLVPRRVKRKA